VANTYHIDYGFNQRNQLSAIGGFANFHYDANGNMTNRELVWGNTNETNFAYDELNRVTQTELENYGGIYARSHYQYDNLNREIATWRDEQSSKGERFGYDAIGQLTSVAYNADQVWTGNPLNATRNVTYTLDALNRQSVNDNGTATGYSPNGMNQYTQWAGQSINYDGNFNFSWIGGWQYNYDAANHLTSIGNGGGTQESFVYDGLGRCVKRTLNGATTIYTYDGWKPMLEWDQWGNLLAWNVYGAGPDEILARGDSTYGTLIYKQDHHGNVVGLLDGAGNGIEKYTYAAFGTLAVTDYQGNPHYDANGRYASWYGNRFLFQGREWYPEIGLYNYRNRFYDPTIGRFIQPDPLGFGGGDANLFRFCHNDPVNKRDPYGLDDDDPNGPQTPYRTDNAVPGAGDVWADYPGVVVTGVPALGRLDRIGALAGEGSSRDTGGSPGTLYAQNTLPPMSNRVVEVAPLPEEPEELPHDHTEVPSPEDAKNSIEGYRQGFIMAMKGCGRHL
jgi:RHS repeat-associated protein